MRRIGAVDPRYARYSIGTHAKGHPHPTPTTDRPPASRTAATWPTARGSVDRRRRELGVLGEQARARADGRIVISVRQTRQPEKLVNHLALTGNGIADRLTMRVPGQPVHRHHVHSQLRPPEPIRTSQRQLHVRPGQTHSSGHPATASPRRGWNSRTSSTPPAHPRPSDAAASWPGSGAARGSALGEDNGSARRPPSGPPAVRIVRHERRMTHQRTTPNTPVGLALRVDCMRPESTITLPTPAIRALRRWPPTSDSPGSQPCQSGREGRGPRRTPRDSRPRSRGRLTSRSVTSDGRPYEDRQLVPGVVRRACVSSGRRTCVPGTNVNAGR